MHFMLNLWLYRVCVNKITVICLLEFFADLFGLFA